MTPQNTRLAGPDDAALRAFMRSGLSRSDGPALQALEDRVLAQWSLRGQRPSAAQPVAPGLLAMGQGGTHPGRWALGVLLAVATVTCALTLQARLLDAGLKDLGDLDVLSLMVEGVL